GILLPAIVSDQCRRISPARAGYCEAVFKKSVGATTLQVAPYIITIPFFLERPQNDRKKQSLIYENDCPLVSPLHQPVNKQADHFQQFPADIEPVEFGRRRTDSGLDEGDPPA